MSQINNVAVLGSICLDDVTTLVGSSKDKLGGSAIYAALASSIFTKTGIMGKVGGDFPPEYFGLLKNHGIDTESVNLLVADKTFRWQATYDKDMNCSCEHIYNLEMNETPEILDACKNAKYLLLANQDPDTQMDVFEKVRSEFTVADTREIYIREKKNALTEIIYSSDAVIMNEQEARLYYNNVNTIQNGHMLADSANRHIAIIKKGEHGAILFNKDECTIIPAIPVANVVDTTGAGDSFAGAFIGWLSRTNDLSDNNIKRAVAIGSACASFTIEDFGIYGLERANYVDVLDRYFKLVDMTKF